MAPSHSANADRSVATVVATENSWGTSQSQKSTTDKPPPRFGARVIERRGLPVVDLDEVILGILKAVRSRDLAIGRARIRSAKSLDKPAGCDLQKASQGEVRRGAWYADIRGRVIVHQYLRRAKVKARASLF